MESRNTEQYAFFLPQMQQLWRNPQPQYCSPHQQSNSNGSFPPAPNQYCITFQDERPSQPPSQFQRPPQQTSGTNTWYLHNHWYDAYEHPAPTQPLQPFLDHPLTWQWPNMFNSPPHHLHPSPAPPPPPPPLALPSPPRTP